MSKSFFSFEAFFNSVVMASEMTLLEAKYCVAYFFKVLVMALSCFS